MRASAVTIVIAHSDDDDPTLILDELVDYSINRGLFDDIGVRSSQLVVSFPIAEDEDGVADWESIGTRYQLKPGD